MTSNKKKTRCRETADGVGFGVLRSLWMFICTQRWFWGCLNVELQTVSGSQRYEAAAQHLWRLKREVFQITLLYMVLQLTPSSKCVITKGCIKVALATVVLTFS